MKIKRWIAAMLAGTLLCAPMALAAEVRDEPLPEKSDSLLLSTAAPRQAEQDAEAAGLLKYSTVTDWSEDLTRLNMAELAAAFYEIISGTTIEPVAVGTFSDCDAVAVRKVAAVDLMTGISSGMFKPDYTSSRSELAVILSRVIAKCGFSTIVYEDEVLHLPSDVAPSGWYYQSVAFLCVKTGYAQPLFKPNYTATGADALEWELALYNLYNGKTPGQPEGTTWQDAGLQTEPVLEGTTFFIYTPEELAWIAQKSLAGTTFTGKTVCLKADIDISAHEWVPIGSGDVEFQGVFDGGGHTISGLRVGSREWPAALPSGFLQGGIVRNVGYASGEVYSTNGSVAVLCAATAENCYSNVLVASNGIYTDRFLTLRYGSLRATNSYVRYHAEKNGYAGCHYFGGDTAKEMTAAELKAETFLQTLNDNSNQTWAMWQRGADGYPVMNTQVPHPDKSWIATAQPWVVDETNPDMYLIYTPEQLAQVAKEASQGNNFQGKTVRLMVNLDLSGRQWTPIGIKEVPFQGKFDGNHHTISGLAIGAEGASSTAYVAAGLFGYVGGEIVSLNLTEVYISSHAKEYDNYVGGLVGYLGDGTVTDCTVQGAVSNETAYGYAGGLVGYATGPNNTKIERCSTNVAVDAHSAGGLIGGAFQNVSVRECLTEGATRGSEAAGGLLGTAYHYVYVYNSYTTGACVAEEFAGGLIGDTPNSGNMTIQSSYTIGSITAAKAGGVIGQIEDSNSYTVSNTHWSRDAQHIEDGLALADANKRGIKNAPVGFVDKTIGNTLAELCHQDTYEPWTDGWNGGWNFDTVWAIDPDKNGGLPYLRWQSIAQQPVVGVTLNKHDLTLYRGEELYLSASISPANAANHKVTWTSSAPAVATVSEYGLVTAVDGGTAVITVTTEDGGFTDTCTVTVSKRSRPVTAAVGPIVLKTESGQLLTQIPTGGSFLAEANVTVQGQPSADYYIMLAVYDTNGALCDLNYMRTRIGNSQPIAYAATIYNRPGRTIGKIKVMVLDGLSSLVPLGNVASWGE